MKKVAFKDAVNQHLAHDICEIEGQTIKRVAFKRNHLITDKDEEVFLKLGKKHFYVLENGDDNLIHEEDAARVLADKCNQNQQFNQSNVSMGKINLMAQTNGFFKVSATDLINLNLLGEISCGSISNYSYVQTNDLVASMRIIPLFTTKAKIKAINELQTSTDIFQIIKPKVTKIGVITTGSEVFSGKVTDGFYPRLQEKLGQFDLTISKQVFVDDQKKEITAAINQFEQDGYDLILVTGGMSVDPDDLTPGAIKATGANIISYGSPVIPGSMFLVAYLNQATVLGLPGAVIYEKRTAFDVVLPQVLLKERLTNYDIQSLAIGGILRD